MRGANRKIILPAVMFLAVAGLSQLALESYVEARAGGGRSGGYRGSRTYQSPARPSQPSQPRREASPPPQQSSPLAPQPGGFMRGIGGAILGGFLGSMLFSGLAHAGWGGFGGSGFGLIEILLMAGVGYFLYRKFLSPGLATGYGAMPYQNTGYQNTGSNIPPSMPAREEPVSSDPDFRSILMMDRSFDPSRFLKTAQDLFFKVQGAWNRQNARALAALCGPELMKTWEQELADLRARGQKNRMENIALSSSEMTEAWTETGQDYITVRLQANLLDYTVDATSGADEPALAETETDPAPEAAEPVEESKGEET